MASRPPTEPLFAATLGQRDPDAWTRWLTSSASVLLGVPAIIATPLALAMFPMFGLYTPSSPQDPFVALHLDSGEIGEDAWLQQASVGLALEAPTPEAPTPTAPPPPAEDHPETVDPEQPPEPTPDPVDTEVPSSPETPAEDGEQAVQGAEDGDADDGTEETTPTRAAGTSPELAPGEMATCLVRPIGTKWDVTGCAPGLHTDAIALARSAARGGRVMVTLRGA